MLSFSSWKMIHMFLLCRELSNNTQFVYILTKILANGIFTNRIFHHRRPQRQRWSGCHHRATPSPSPLLYNWLRCPTDHGWPANYDKSTITTSITLSFDHECDHDCNHNHVHPDHVLIDHIDNDHVQSLTTFNLRPWSTFNHARPADRGCFVYVVFSTDRGWPS